MGTKQTKLFLTIICLINGFALTNIVSKPETVKLDPTTVISHSFTDDNNIVITSKKEMFPTRRFDLKKLNIYLNRPAHKVQIEVTAYNIEQLHYYQPLPLELILQINNLASISLVQNVEINYDFAYEYFLDNTNIIDNNLNIGLDFHWFLTDYKTGQHWTMFPRIYNLILNQAIFNPNQTTINITENTNNVLFFQILEQISIILNNNEWELTYLNCYIQWISPEVDRTYMIKNNFAQLLIPIQAEYLINSFLTKPTSLNNFANCSFSKIDVEAVKLTNDRDQVFWHYSLAFINDNYYNPVSDQVELGTNTLFIPPAKGLSLDPFVCLQNGTITIPMIINNILVNLSFTFNQLTPLIDGKNSSIQTNNSTTIAKFWQQLQLQFSPEQLANFSKIFNYEIFLTLLAKS